ncbi:protein-disulfide reductase DsbD [Spongiibacter nanhainus]|uniref:Protein-disulfide reductase DsbD n=1 Tax=Spongiibacter nanhainus TaxID=2794344 RepID=A0A7T4R1J0_9GAMM|nr:protein-disulfide reductase DsbD [Spongiibacter nanhainus]QQD18602.1 protein-disulfide reductase DsbD [Spongiibacter nanhainus]
MKISVIYIVVILNLLLSSSAHATDVESNAEQFLPVEQAYQMTPEIDGDTLLIRWHIAEGYYLYGSRFKAAIIEGEHSQSLAIKLPRGKHKRDEYFGDVEVFYHQLKAQLALPTRDPFTLRVSSQGCADAGLCYPPNHRLYRVEPDSGTLTRIDGGSTSTINSDNEIGTTLDAGTASSIGVFSIPQLLAMAALAFAGGLILNLMPCVFPVLALKAIGLLESSDSSAGERRMHGLIYTAGVVASFMLVAGLLILLRASGQELGWGYQLQSPWFVAALVYLFFIMGLSFSGAIELGSGLTGVGQNLVEKGGLSGSFFTGVLAVVVASPCTAPFMGASLGFALTQPMPIALTIFLALGLGMATPFLLISIVPGLGRLLPRPGNWMVTLKEIMAFPMYLTGIWLLWVLGRQAGINAAMLVLVGCVFVAVAVYFWNKPTRWHRGLAVSACLGAALVLSGITPETAAIQTPSTEQSKFPLTADGDALRYSPARLSALHQDGGPIFLNVTADWCITCKANEKIALGTDTVKNAMSTQHIRYMKADWTNRNAEVSRLLAHYQRSGVPLYVFFPGSGKPAVVLPQLLSKEKVLTAFKAAQGS